MVHMLSILENQEIRDFEIEFKSSLKNHKIKYDLLPDYLKEDFDYINKHQG